MSKVSSTLIDASRDDQHLISWLRDVSIPLWLEHGIDPSGGFHECLGFDLKPVVCDKRLRTMARQTFAFATAYRLGWHRDAARSAMEHGLQFLSVAARGDGDGFAKTFTFDGTVNDPTRDTYDYAFVLFAAAACVAAGHPEGRSLGEDVFSQLESDFYLGTGLGYREFAGQDDGPRRANPHMHLLEAMTAWTRATGDTTASDRANEIISLFHNRLFEPETWSLREHLAFDLAPLTGTVGELREPGHHFEWAWLLHDVQPEDADTIWAGRRLHASAAALGLSPVSGLPYHEVTSTGEPVQRHARVWSQTEVIRAMVVRQMQGLDPNGVGVDAAIEKLFASHIDPAPDGLWIDTIDAMGAPESPHVPASILYHLLGAALAVMGDTVSGKVEG